MTGNVCARDPQLTTLKPHVVAEATPAGRRRTHHFLLTHAQEYSSHGQ
jgi:hypothetical protein